MRTIVFQREDGTQVLVQIYADDRATMAERDHTWETWGPPVASSVDVVESMTTMTVRADGIIEGPLVPSGGTVVLVYEDPDADGA